MTRLALASASLLLAACGTTSAGGSAGEAATSAAATVSRVRVLTERDHGKTVWLRTGRTATLRVVPAGAVRTTGRAARLVRVEYIVDPGFREWEVVAARAGTTVITGPRTGGGRFRFTVRVTAG